MNKVVRSICYFSDAYDDAVLERLNVIAQKLKEADFIIQTRRICVSNAGIQELDNTIQDKDVLLSIGAVNEQQLQEKLDEFINVDRCSLNLDLTDVEIVSTHVDVLFDVINRKSSKTFNFAYTFNNAPTSPYFPSASYEKDGFAIGLQPTDLAKGCTVLSEWFERMVGVWHELDELLKNEKDYLGIDSSIAPLFENDSSFIDFVRRLHGSFEESVLTDTYLSITKFIKEKNPKPVGLCGLMIPCLEDFELAKEYDLGNFTIERNLFLSLHSGLGIDVYPIGIDESPERILNILKVVQGLSKKYKKPLSARFVSDGQSSIGDKTDFKNQYLKDIIVRKL